MADQKDTPLLASRWALKMALYFYALFVTAFAVNFFEPTMNDKGTLDPFSLSVSTWGQFGDYVGGVINPIVGLITIWLLTVSLKQSQKEMELTRKALQDAEASQKATEAALRAQIEVAQEAKDMNNAIALWGKLDASYINLQSRIANDEKILGANAEYVIQMKEQLKYTEKGLLELGAIMQIETARIVKKHLPDGALS